MSSADDKHVAAQADCFRYPRTQPFGDNELDQRAFYGRETEYAELVQRIMSTRLLVLYGRSGLGKTSLLQAGVYPELRKQNLLPLPVRINRPEQPFLETFRAAIAEACERQGVDYTPGEGPGLWEFFKTAVFWREGELQTPVLVLDQFEELFTLHGPETRNAIVRELGELVAPHLPERVRARLDAGEDLPFSHKSPHLKVILSLRESYLGELEALTTELPQVLSDRFRLTALNRENARRAIVAPAELDPSLGYCTPAFSYAADTLDAMLEFLAGDGNVVEPFALQLLCAHVERKLIAPREQAEVQVQLRDLGGRLGMERVLGAFYQDSVRTLHSARQRKHARRLCSEGLLSPDGRRLSLEEAQIRQQFKLSQATLDRLTEERLLRREPRLESHYYELSHDRLTAPILKTRKWHMPRAARIALATAGVALPVFIVLFLLSVGTVVLLEEEQTRTAQERDQANELIYRIVFDLGVSLRAIDRIDLLEEPLTDSRSYYENRLETLSLDELNAYGAILTTLGDIHMLQGEIDKALDVYEDSIYVYRMLAEYYPEEIYLKRNLVISLQRVATQQGGFKAPEAVRPLAVEAVGVLREIVDDQASAENIDLLITNLEVLAQIEEALGDLDAARALYQEIHERAGTARRDYPDYLPFLSMHAWSYIYLGDFFGRDGKIADAMEQYEQARDLFAHGLLQSRDDTGLRLGLGATNERLGNMYAARFELRAARNAYVALGSIFRRLAADDPDNINWARNTAVAEVHLSEINLAAMRQLSAMRAFESAWEQAGRRAQSLALLPPAYADHAEVARQLAEAAESLNEAEELISQLLDEQGVNLEWMQDLIQIYAMQAEIADARGDPGQARSYYEWARKIGYDILASQGHEDMVTAEMVYFAHLRSAQFALRQGQVVAAAEEFERALDYAKRGHAATDEQRWISYIADATEGRGDARLAAGDRAAARSAYAEALKLREELVAARPEHVAWEMELAITLYKNARLAEPGNAEALAQLGRARAIVETVERAQGSPVFLRIVRERIAASPR